MKFMDCINKLRDGKAYAFSHPNLLGYFYKAPFPEDQAQTELDEACSAITYWVDNRPAMPIMLLDDFDRDDWNINQVTCHPSQL